MSTTQAFITELVAKNAAAAGMSVEDYRRRQLARLRDAMRQIPEDDCTDCQACAGRGFIGRLGQYRCPECN